MSDTTASSSPEAEGELLARARTGDEAAFGELVRSHYEPVFRLVYSIVRHEQDARDVCQEVWVSVWKKLHTFRGDARFSTWLHPIAVRRSVDHLRRRQKWYARYLPFAGGEEDVEAAVPEPADPSDPRRELEQAERDGRFERALALLQPNHRAVLALREVEGLSYDEIAKTLHCRPGTVMSRLYHARRQLVRKLGELPCD